MLLEDSGVSQDLLESLQSHMKSGGLDMGWERVSTSEISGFTGTTTDREGEPLGGLRVVLLSSDHQVLNWSYSAPDGRYDVWCPEEVEPAFIRFSGRGDLVLKEFALHNRGELGEIKVDTITGVVVDKDGEAIPGVSVQLLYWKEEFDSSFSQTGSKGGGLTWGDSNELGAFVVPVRIDNRSMGWQAVLEILAPKGQTLRKLMVNIHPTRNLALGQLVCPRPEVEWGGEPVAPRASVAMYPGVSERPLS